MASRAQAQQAAERFARSESEARGVPFVAPVGGVLVAFTPEGEGGIELGGHALATQPLDPLI
eukprot:3694322-Amphidinium_carterae.1